MNSLTKRIIPCLDVKNGRVVKGINFIGLKDAGDPVEIAKRYNNEGADEIALLDITASNEQRRTIVDVVEKIAKEVFIPLTIGGGIKSIDDIHRLLDAGCDKISLNSAAIDNPKLINEAALKFGSQCIVVAIDAKKINSTWNAYKHGGRVNTGVDAIEWAKQAQELGAGEILLTSMDADGTKDGYDLNLIKTISQSINIPTIASGGAGTMEHIKDAFLNGADAALAASIFHFKEIDIMDLKKYLNSQGVSVRL